MVSACREAKAHARIAGELHCCTTYEKRGKLLELSKTDTPERKRETSCNVDNQHSQFVPKMYRRSIVPAPAYLIAMTSRSTTPTQQLAPAWRQLKHCPIVRVLAGRSSSGGTRRSCHSPSSSTVRLTSAAARSKIEGNKYHCEGFTWKVSRLRNVSSGGTRREHYKGGGITRDSELRVLRR